MVLFFLLAMYNGDSPRYSGSDPPNELDAGGCKPPLEITILAARWTKITITITGIARLT